MAREGISLHERAACRSPHAPLKGGMSSAVDKAGTKAQPCPSGLDLYDNNSPQYMRRGNIRHYNFKAVLSGETAEAYFFDEPVFYGFTNKRTQSKRKTVDEMTLAERAASIERRKRYRKKCSADVARIIDANASGRMSWLTLTFRDHVTDHNAAKKELERFFKRMRRYLSRKHNNTPLKYIWVWEYTQKGRVHFHLVLFDIPFIKNTLIEGMWRNGFVKIKRIENKRHESIGSYMTKYMGKAFDEPSIAANTRLYSTSNNLKKPRERVCSIEIESKRELMDALETRASFKNTYFMRRNEEQLQMVRYYKLPTKIFEGIIQGTSAEKKKLGYNRYNVKRGNVS
jgi:hypothetical protein